MMRYVYCWGNSGMQMLHCRRKIRKTDHVKLQVQSYLLVTEVHFLHLPQFLITLDIQILLQDLCGLVRLVKDDDKRCESGND